MIARQAGFSASYGPVGMGFGYIFESSTETAKGSQGFEVISTRHIDVIDYSLKPSSWFTACFAEYPQGTPGSAEMLQVPSSFRDMSQEPPTAESGRLSCDRLFTQSALSDAFEKASQGLPVPESLLSEYLPRYQSERLAVLEQASEIIQNYYAEFVRYYGAMTIANISLGGELSAVHSFASENLAAEDKLEIGLYLQAGIDSESAFNLGDLLASASGITSTETHLNYSKVIDGLKDVTSTAYYSRSERQKGASSERILNILSAAAHGGKFVLDMSMKYSTSYQVRIANTAKNVRHTATGGKPELITIGGASNVGDSQANAHMEWSASVQDFPSVVRSVSIPTSAFMAFGDRFACTRLLEASDQPHLYATEADRERDFRACFASGSGHLLKDDDSTREVEAHELPLVSRWRKALVRAATEARLRDATRLSSTFEAARTAGEVIRRGMEMSDGECKDLSELVRWYTMMRLTDWPELAPMEPVDCDRRGEQPQGGRRGLHSLSTEDKTILGNKGQDANKYKGHATDHCRACLNTVHAYLTYSAQTGPGPHNLQCTTVSSFTPPSSLQCNAFAQLWGVSADSETKERRIARHCSMLPLEVEQGLRLHAALDTKREVQAGTETRIEPPKCRVQTTSNGEEHQVLRTCSVRELCVGVGFCSPMEVGYVRSPPRVEVQLDEAKVDRFKEEHIGGKDCKLHKLFRKSVIVTATSASNQARASRMVHGDSRESEEAVGGAGTGAVQATSDGSAPGASGGSEQDTGDGTDQQAADQYTTSGSSQASEGTQATSGGPSDSTVATPSQRIPLDEGEVLRQVSKDLAGVSMELEHFMLRVKGTGQESCPDRKEFEDTAPTGSLQLSLGFPAGMQVTEIADHHFALEFSVDRLDTLYLHKVDDDTTPEGHILREPHGEALFERPPMLGTITLAVKLMSTKTHVVLWRVPSSCQGGSRASTVFPRLDVAQTKLNRVEGEASTGYHLRGDADGWPQPMLGGDNDKASTGMCMYFKTKDYPSELDKCTSTHGGLFASTPQEYLEAAEKKLRDARDTYERSTSTSVPADLKAVEDAEQELFDLARKYFVWGVDVEQWSFLQESRGITGTWLNKAVCNHRS